MRKHFLLSLLATGFLCANFTEDAQSGDGYYLRAYSSNCVVPVTAYHVPVPRYYSYSFAYNGLYPNYYSPYYYYPPSLGYYGTYRYRSRSVGYGYSRYSYHGNRYSYRSRYRPYRYRSSYYRYR
ncbi:MAG: hypothetical protein JKY95_06425 [Planctomycetaceae bacterium]|nr:hypothetical protein [Planctomycetaceae bacterium]